MLISLFLVHRINCHRWLDLIVCMSCTQVLGRLHRIALHRVASHMLGY